MRSDHDAFLAWAWRERWTKAERRRNRGRVWADAGLALGAGGVVVVLTGGAGWLAAPWAMAMIFGVLGRAELGQAVAIALPMVWVGVTLAAGLAATAWVGERRAGAAAVRAYRSGQCAGCDYDLSATGEARPGWRTCPECGLHQPAGEGARVFARENGPRDEADAG